MKKKQISLQVKEELWQRIVIIAQKEGLAESDFVEQILEKFMIVADFAETQEKGLLRTFHELLASRRTEIIDD